MLAKSLRTADVFYVTAGGMLSSLFLVPGLAAGHTGAGVVLAYLLGGLLILPAVASLAELATAMPRAGGPYYYLDRTLGPLVGTIGGIATWVVLILKSAFGLIGIGIYLALLVDVPPVPIALGTAALLVGVNLAGARESSRLLQVLVPVLLAALVLFAVWGGVRAVGREVAWTPVLPGGADGMLAALGLVAVTFIGLVKSTSLAEEVRDPERAIPRGLGLAVLGVTLLYVAATAVMVAGLGAEALAASATPVADAAVALAPAGAQRAVLTVVVAGAIIAFAAMGNAGILAASRYPVALARDGIFPAPLGAATAGGTPVAGVAATGLLLAITLVTLDVEAVAKLGSAVLLLLFALLNVGVIVMRESGIESYDPGYRAPFYPWTQLAGIFVPLVLVAEMGWLPVLFTLGLTGLCFGWYTYYARARIAREGAIFHVFDRLARRRFEGLDQELRAIMKEKGARPGDPFDAVVARADVIDLNGDIALRELLGDGARRLAQRVPVTAAELEEGLAAGVRTGLAPMARGALLLHARIPEYDGSEMLLARVRDGVLIGEAQERAMAGRHPPTPVHAIVMLVSGAGDAGRHLRILAQIAGRVDSEWFMRDWLAGGHEHELKEVLLRDDRFLTLELAPGGPAAPLIGRTLRELRVPEGSLVALIRRGTEDIVPHGRTVLRAGDRLTVIGEPEGLRELGRRFGA